MPAGKTPFSSLGCSQQAKDHCRAWSHTSELEVLSGFFFWKCQQAGSLVWSFKSANRLGGLGPLCIDGHAGLGPNGPWALGPWSSGCKDHGPHNVSLFPGWNFVILSVRESTVF